MIYIEAKNILPPACIDPTNITDPIMLVGVAHLRASHLAERNCDMSSQSNDLCAGAYRRAAVGRPNERSE